MFSYRRFHLLSAGPLHHKQLGKKSFRSYVLGNLDAHHVGAMPILYRLG